MARIPTAQDGGIFQGTGILPTQQVPVRPFFRTAGGATAETFGAGVGRAAQGAAQAVSGLGRTLADIATQVQLEETERQAKEADLQYSKRVRELMFGNGTPENPGFYSLEGKAAVEAQPGILEELARARADLAVTLNSNQRAQQLFTDAANTRFETEANRIATHSFQQGKVAAQDASEARRNEFIDDAVARYNDPAAVRAGYMAGYHEALQFELDRGVEQSVAESRAGEYGTVFHRAIIDRFLADDDYTTALAYFEKRKGEIDGRTHAGILEDIAQHTVTHAAGIATDARDHIKVLNEGGQAAGLEETKALIDSVPINSAGATFEAVRHDFYESLSDQPVIAEFMQKPLAEVEGSLATFRARLSSTDPNARPTLDEARRMTKIGQIFEANKTAFANGDGLTVAAQYGVVDVTPIDWFNADSLRARVAQARTASEVYGTEVSPLTQADVQNLADFVTGKGQPTPPAIEDVARVLSAVHAGLGEDGAAFAVQDLIEKRYGYLGVALQVAADRPAIAQEMITGNRFLQANPEYKIKDQDRLERGADVLGNLLTPETAAARGPIMEGADALYAIRAQQAGSTDYDPEIHRQAILDTVGGIVEHNGTNIIPPTPNLSQSQFDAIMDNLATVDLVDENGDLPTFADGTEFTADLLRASIWRDEAHLVSTSMNGTYNIKLDGVGYVLNSTGTNVFELNLRNIAPQITSATATPNLVGPGGEANLPEIVEAELQMSAARRAQRVAGQITSIPEPGRSRGGPPPGKPDTVMGQSRRFTAVAEFSTVKGVPTKVYNDSRGIPTIGIGFNLAKPGARELIEGLGYDYQRVLSGDQTIDVADAETLFNRDYAEARRTAAELFPNYGEIEPARRAVLNDLAFNLGAQTLSEFRGFIAAVAAGDWKRAADELKYVNPGTDTTLTPYFTQVGRRATRNIRVLRTGQFQGL